MMRFPGNYHPSGRWGGGSGMGRLGGGGLEIDWMMAAFGG